MGAPPDSPHTSQSDRYFIYQPRFPMAESQMSASFTLFNGVAGTAEQKQFPLVPLRGTQKKRNPHFVTSQSKCAIVWGLPAEPLAPVESEVWSPGRSCRSLCPLCGKGWGHLMPSLTRGSSLSPATIHLQLPLQLLPEPLALGVFLNPEATSAGRAPGSSRTAFLLAAVCRATLI